MVEIKGLDHKGLGVRVNGEEVEGRKGGSFLENGIV